MVDVVEWLRYMMWSYVWLWILMPWLCDMWENACCDICLMNDWGWIVGGTMLMVSMILIVYNDDLLDLVLLKIGMMESTWYVNVFEFEPLGWSGVKWWDSDFGNLW